LGSADVTAPYSIIWLTSDGNYTLTAIATDSSGNSTTSSPITVTVANQPPTANLLFKSGFEDDVRLTDQNLGEWPEKFLGTDSTTGFTWETDMPGNASASYFNYLVGSGNTVDDFVTTRIETVTGPYGNPTKVFYHEVIGDDPATTANSRSQYNIYPEGTTPTEKLERLYARYWTKFDSNLPSALSWRLMMEWLNGDYRWGIYIYQGANGPYWHVKGQLLPENTTPWAISNTTVAVPIDEWFLLEAIMVH